MARLDENAAANGRLIEQTVRDAFTRAGWRVEKEPIIGTVRPDLLAQGPNGETFVVEIKASMAPVHFATVAQVAGFGRLAQETRHLDRVRSVLVSTSPVSASAREAAAALDVTVIEVPGKQATGTQWTEALASQLVA